MVAVFKASKYQQAVYDAITNTDSNIVVNAVAGSGKTTMIVQAANLPYLHGKEVLMVAFNKHIADELRSRLPYNVESSTIHSIGKRCLDRYFGKIIIYKDDKKYKSLCQKYGEVLHNSLEYNYNLSKNSLSRSAVVEPPKKKDLIFHLRKLVSLSISTMINKDSVEEFADMIDYQGIELDETFYESYLKTIRDIISDSLNQIEKEKLVAFDDMLLYPVYANLTFQQYDFIFCDEVQDLSKGQLEIVMRSLKPTGRITVVGDPKQSIYGFSGADPESFNRVIERTNAIELPLSVCYRCPESHIKLAQEIVPQIEARDNAPAGIVDYVSQDQAITMLEFGDVVMCRMTAPLITLCLTMIAAGKPAKVKGRDIAAQLAIIVEQIAKLDNFNWSKFADFLEQYRKMQTVIISQNDGNESQLESMHDRLDGVLACQQAFPKARDIKELCLEINNLFSDEKQTITLCTVHRAKGLEANRTFILSPEKLPLRWKNQQQWQLVQEINLRYVALTRSRNALYFITNGKFSKPVTEEIDQLELPLAPVVPVAQQTTETAIAELFEVIKPFTSELSEITATAKPVKIKAISDSDLSNLRCDDCEKLIDTCNCDQLESKLIDLSSIRCESCNKLIDVCDCDQTIYSINF